MNRLDYILSTMKHVPRKTKVLVLFDGSGCISKTLKQMGFDVRALDILPLNHIDLPMDIMDFVPQLLGDWVPDMVWASPPCETFSIVTARKGGGNLYYQTIKVNGKVTNIYPRNDFKSDKRFKKLSDDQIKVLKAKVWEKQNQHLGFVQKTVEIIEYYTKLNPEFIWFIENPASGFIRHQLKGLFDHMVENKTTYCMYGSEYRKETSIFSNIQLYLFYCPKHRKGITDLCGGHKDTLVQRYDNKAQEKGVVKKSTYLERSSIPEKLCMDIFNQAKKVAVSV